MKTIVITGATSGIGNLLVKEFIKQGCRVFAGYRDVKLKKTLVDISENVVPFRIDLSKKWAIADAIKFILEKLGEDGEIDTLINAAGCVCAGPMECLSVDKIREQFEVNTFAHLEFSQGLFEKLQGGKIINISSMASFGLFPFVAPYCASKRALDILFNSMQLECGHDVRVVSIKPGAIKTPLWEKSIEANKEVLENNEKYKKEAEFLIRNAQENSKKGLDPQVVADFIVRVEGMEKPKASYTIGIDAKWAAKIALLPQDWINFIVYNSFKERLEKGINAVVDFITLRK